MRKDGTLVKEVGCLYDNVNYIQKAFVTRLKVRSVPLKPSITNVTEVMSDSQERKFLIDALLNKVSSAYRMRPMTLLSSNVGSNVGLMEVLLRLFRRKSDKGLQIILCDVNIYWRIAKIFMSGHYLITGLRECFFPFLGYWHCIH
eukprot:415943-Amorphochlora_amoeboformis.AAC.1